MCLQGLTFFEYVFEPLTILLSVSSSPHLFSSLPSSPHLLFECSFEPPSWGQCIFEPYHVIFVRLSFSTWIGHPLQWDPFLGRSPITMRPLLFFLVGHPLQWDPFVGRSLITKRPFSSLFLLGWVTHYNETLSLYFFSPGRPPITMRLFKKNSIKKRKRRKLFTIILLYKTYYTKSKENKFSNAFAP